MKHHKIYIIIFFLFLFSFYAETFSYPVSALPDTDTFMEGEDTEPPYQDPDAEITETETPDTETESPEPITDYTNEPESAVPADNYSNNATDASDDIVTPASDYTSEIEETSSVQPMSTSIQAAASSPNSPLPSTIEEISFPRAIGIDVERAQTNLFAGIASWSCIAIGISVIVSILISTKNSEWKGGKQRYDAGNKIIGRKRLLSDEYYQGKK